MDLRYSTPAVGDCSHGISLSEKVDEGAGSYWEKRCFLPIRMQVMNFELFCKNIWDKALKQKRKSSEHIILSFEVFKSLNKLFILYEKSWKIQIIEK